MKQSTQKNNDIWLVQGVRTPFAKVDGALSEFDAISLSVPVVQAMVNAGDEPIRPDVLIWGTVAPNLAYSNIAREVLIDGGLDQTIPAFSTIMACSTSMMGAIEAAGLLQTSNQELALVGGVESMSGVQFGLKQGLSTFLRTFFQARSTSQRLGLLKDLSFSDIRLHIPSITNRTTGLSMGEHCEQMAKEWNISREDQDAYTLKSHQKVIKGQNEGFFDDLVIEVNGADKDTIPRASTSMEALQKLKPVFDRESGKGTLTAANSSPITDGASSIWVASTEGLKRLPKDLAKVKLVDWEIAAVDIQKEGLLMAPAYAIPRLLERNQLSYADIDLWEIHEAFAAQVLCNVAALESSEFLSEKVGTNFDFGKFPWDKLNPNGGSLAIGHPFGATGTRDLSQATKQLAAMPKGSRAIISVCADGGVGTVALIEAA